MLAALLVSELPPGLVLGFAFVLGATWGSFFNVAIYRWPRDMSVVTPPSHCPACHKPVPGWRNVPILAYLIQRGKAACCGAPMTPRYVLVEILSGVLAVALAQRFIVHTPDGTTLEAAGLAFVVWFVFVGGLIIATFIDLEHMFIPEEVTIGGTAIGLATMALREGPGMPTPLELALGAGAGYLGVLLLLVHGSKLVLGKRGMGEGDATFMLFIGIFLGWQGVLFALVGGSMQGIIATVISKAAGRPIGMRRQTEPALEAKVEPPESDEAKPTGDTKSKPKKKRAKKDAEEPKLESKPLEETADEGAEDPDDGLARIPFGPFLALGALEFLFFGEQITAAYVSYFLS
jgi:leader peptidase (prepilin peptidase)/N-methyltransferase